MQKVSEKVDLSKKVLEIDIQSPIFNCMLHDLNREIQRVVNKVYEEEFEAGEINVKLVLTIPSAYMTFSKKNEFGETVNENYLFRKPCFEHKVTTTLKKQYKQEGLYTEDKEVKFEDGQYIVVPIIAPISQLELFDEEEFLK